MSKIKKKITFLLLTAAMCLSCIPASAADTAEQSQTAAETQTEQAPQTFTIDEAIKYAKEHSLTIAAAKAQVDTSKAQKEQTRKSYRDAKRAVFSSDMGASSDGTFLLLGGYTYKSAIFGYAAAQRAVVQAERSTENLVINNFYIYLNDKKILKLRQDALESAKTRRMQAETRYDNGSISQLDLEEFKISEKEAKNTVNAAERAVEHDMRQLKYALNYPQDQELIVAGTFERPQIDDTVPEQAIEKAKKSIAWVNADETLELAGIKLDKSISHYTSNSLGARTARSEYAQAELDYQTTLNSNKLNIYQQYNNMLNTAESLELLDERIALLEKKTEAQKRLYELGSVTASDYLDVVRAVDEAKASLAEAEIKFYLAIESYKMTYDCENTITQEEDTVS